MDIKIEQRFVKAFIEKSVQDRFLHDLSLANKRKCAWDKLSHSAEKYLRPQYIYMQGEKLDSKVAESEIGKLTSDTQHCYVIADFSTDELFPLKQALEQCYADNMLCIVIVDDRVAFIKTESEKGAPKKYILYNADFPAAKRGFNNA